jgi:hypothetical protein
MTRRRKRSRWSQLIEFRWQSDRGRAARATCLEHEWIGVHQLRLDRKRRRRASVLMRPPYCRVIREAGEPMPCRRVGRCRGWTGVSHSSAAEGRPYLGKSRQGRSDHASARTRPPLSPPSCAPRTALVHRSVAAAEYITDPMMQLITSGNDQSESKSGLFIPIRG